MNTNHTSSVFFYYYSVYEWQNEVMRERWNERRKGRWEGGRERRNKGKCRVNNEGRNKTIK